MDINTERKHSIETNIDYYRSIAEEADRKIENLLAVKMDALAKLAQEESKLYEFFGWAEES